MKKNESNMRALKATKRREKRDKGRGRRIKDICESKKRETTMGSREQIKKVG